MLRIGKAPINIPAGVVAAIKDSIVTVEGKLGELTQGAKDIAVRQENGHLVSEPTDDTKEQNAKHGLYRTLIHSVVVGVPEGFTRGLKLVGVGYRVTNQGQKLDLILGFPHNILLGLPQEIRLETVNEKSKNPITKLTFHDKQLLGQVTAKIYSFHKPKPYKGKNVKFMGEVLRRKTGRSAQ